jgi:hypothetical protein
MAIIENNINDIYNRLKKAKISKEKLEKIDLPLDKNGATYKKKSKDIRNDKLKKMW